jgi:hypothetical protein
MYTQPAESENDMTIKTKAGQIWTDSVAYVALVLGAGVSIAGNVANVLRVRGEATDGLDLFMAGFFPGLVVLMVEVFVSARWRGLAWPMQALRWVGCGAVTVVAMRVSWVHLHALMTSRGQEADVAILGPLAIDFLAIMATALILAGRGIERPAATTPETADEILARRQEDMDRMDARTATLTSAVATQSDVDESAAILANPTAYMASLADEATSYLERLAGELDSATTAAHPVSPAPMSNTVKPESIPGAAKDALFAWALADEVTRPTAKDRNELLAAEFGVSTRTVRRWATALGEITADA